MRALSPPVLCAPPLGSAQRLPASAAPPPIRRRRPCCAAQAGLPHPSASVAAAVRGADFIRPHLRSMAPYTPIVPFDVLSQQLNRAPEDIVKLDANENPYGPPPGACAWLSSLAPPSLTLLPSAEVAQALAALQFPHIYPDPETRRLRAALAADCGVPAENLLAGA